MLRFETLTAAAAVALSAAPAMAAEQYPADMIALSERVVALEAQCRDGIVSPDQAEDACHKRDHLMRRLNQAGWCYGRQGEERGQHRWHRCGPGSWGAPARLPEMPIVSKCRTQWTSGGEINQYYHDQCLRYERAAYSLLEPNWARIPEYIRNGCHDFAVRHAGSYHTIYWCLEKHGFAPR